MRKAIVGVTEVGALLLVLAQFLPLFHTHVTSTPAAIGSGSVGSAHAWSVLLLALLAAFIGGALLVSGSRFSLLLVGVLGVVALVIGLTRDLSDAHAHGLGRVAGHYESATNVIGIGLYVELAGALLLLLAAVGGFLLGGEALAPTPKAVAGPARRSPPRRRRDSLHERRRSE